MDMEILVTKAFIRAIEKHRHPHVVLEKIQLLATNPGHPSLKAHRFRRAPRKEIRECYISDGDRMLYEARPGQLCLWYLGTHGLIEKAHLYSFDPCQQFSKLAVELKHANIEIPKLGKRIMERGNTLYNPGLSFDETLLLHRIPLGRLEDFFNSQAL